jgi:hypothetical protein
MEPWVADFQGVTPRQHLERIREIFRARRRFALNESRNYADVPVKCGYNFESNKVIRII